MANALAQYEDLMNLDHPHFIWMNYGLDGEDFSWICEKLDERWKYQMNLARFTVRGLNLEGKRVLDTGCGRGGNCSFLARYHSPSEVVGLDQSQRQIEWCRQRFSADSLSFVAGDAQSLPFSDGVFDVVTNIESAPHYADKPRFYREVFRVLSPRGYFGHSSNYLHPAKVEASIEAAGFRAVASTDITAGVIDALNKNVENFKELMAEIATSSEARRVGKLVQTALRDHIPKSFSSEHRYMSWVFQRMP